MKTPGSLDNFDDRTSNPAMHSERAVVSIDLARVRSHVARIATATGVGVIAVVKADAYGLGATRVAAAIADAVDGFYVFDLQEALDANLPALGKPIIVLRGDLNEENEFIAARARPVVWDATAAARLRAARPVLAVDTGQQRFACPADALDAVIKAGAIDEAFTHATKVDHAVTFDAITRDLKLRRHAAGSALLSEPAARFDAVRPGLALYDGAVRVTAPLIDARNSTGPAGYSGFIVPRFGLIAVGYSHGLRPGPASIDGRPTRILEVGMQTSFVELSPVDLVGDQVVLLGDEVPLSTIAPAWGCSMQQVLGNLCRAGLRKYAE